MKIYIDNSLENFDAWSGGADTLRALTHEQCEEVETIICELYPDGMSDTELNDLLWFDRDSIAAWLGFDDFEALERHNNGEDEEEKEEEEEEEEEEA